MPSNESEGASAGQRIAEALAAAQDEFPIIPKNKTARVKTKTGGEYKYKYADLADILKAILPILSRHGIAFTQPIRLSPDGKFMRLVTRLLHGSGEVIESDGIPLYEGSSPQDFGGQLTYARRYDGCSLLGIAPDEDEDASIASGKDAEISDDERRPPRRPTAEVKHDQYVADKTAALKKDIDERNAAEAKAKLKKQLQESVDQLVEAKKMDDSKPQPEAKREDPGIISDAQRRMVFAVLQKRGLSDGDLREVVGGLGYESLTELPRSKVRVLLDEIDPDHKFHIRE